MLNLTLFYSGILQWYENYLNLNAQKLSHGDARTQLMTHVHVSRSIHADTLIKHLFKYASDVKCYL